MSTFFDTHCHYNLEPLYSGKSAYRLKVYNEDPSIEYNWRHHWKKSQEKKVNKAVIVGTNKLYIDRAIEIAQTDPNLFASIGFHPEAYANLAKKNDQKEIETTIAEQEGHLTNLLNNHSKKSIVAIGEIGLDYYRLKKDDEHRKLTIISQQQALKMQLKIAIKHKLPAIIHVRDQGRQAYLDILKILKQFYPSDSPFILHCISGSKEYVKQALDLGAYIGFSGIVTYKNTDSLKEILKFTPPNKRLIETDAPFLAPLEYKGKLCEPWMLSLTGIYLHEVFNVDLDLLVENSHKVFSV